jgi:tetratricopeptide (TPR) repeat protein
LNVRLPAVPVALVLLVTACAPRATVAPPAAAPAPPPIDVDAAIREGCYRCLEQAFALAPRFDLAALLALRSKELGLPYQAWRERAAGLMPPGDEWPLYLEIVDVVRVQPQSGDREEILTLTVSQRRETATVDGWRETLKAGTASPLFRAYLDLTLACSAGDRQQAIAEADAEFADVPLIQYRIGTCGSPPHLNALRESRPEFRDVEFPLGRNALESATPDQERALSHFRVARDAFPESALIAVSIGDIHRDREEWAEALEAYNATLALVPTHRDALLGQTMALSNLYRYEAAIASASRLLELGNWFIGGAYFWRAWNHYNLRNIPEARADVDLARARNTGPATLVLSGMVAWRQNQLELAEQEFEAALTLDKGQCEAAALQGGVRAARQRWNEAIASLQHAEQCFDLTIALRRKLIEDIRGGPGSPEGKAAQMARHERAIAEAEKNRDDARQNAAAIQKRLNPSSR